MTQVSSQKKICRIWVGILCILCVFCAGPARTQNTLGQLSFENLPLPPGAPGNETRLVCQDRDGFLWIATNSGLLRYDGYGFITYKSNLYGRNLLTNNTIQTLVEDHRQNLWIGTPQGLNILHKPTGAIRHVDPRNLPNNFIQTLLSTRDGDVWIGTNGGLCRYLSAEETYVTYNRGNTANVLDLWDIKTLMEDASGNVWIGTWSNGFFRYDPLGDTFIAYPALNARNSAHTIVQDSRGDIWIGTWGYGLFRLHNPYDPDRLSYTRYRHDQDQPHSLLDDIVYTLAEDTTSHTLWVGSRSGLSILTDRTDSLSFRNYTPDGGPGSVSHNEVNSILRDREGIMWLGLLGGGVDRVDPRPKQFDLYRIPVDVNRQEIAPNSVRCLLAEENGNVWIGTRNFGLFIHDIHTGQYLNGTRLTDFASHSLPTVNAFLKRKGSGEIWIGTHDGGLFVYDPKKKPGARVSAFSNANSSWLPDDCIYSLFEDSSANVWVGTRNGFVVISSDGTPYTYADIPLSADRLGRQSVTSIAQDHFGNIWLGTNRSGAFRAVGDFHEPDGFAFVRYSSANGKIYSDNITCFYADSRDRFWAGTEGEGLVRYSGTSDSFETVHGIYRLPGDAVFSIEQDRQGNLWLGTNEGLIRFWAEDDPEKSTFRLFTTVDGLQDNVFSSNAVYKKSDGQLFFGGNKGYNSFYPEQVVERVYSPLVVITDIKIFNRSWSQLDEKTKNRISPLAPGHTRKITLSHRDNNINIDFAVLSYAEPSQNKFAYRLSGFDPEWKYTDASRRFAYYNNLRSGTYTFLLRGANERGAWSDASDTLEIVIKPAPWATWWACLLYVCVVALSVWYALRVMQNRIRMRAAVRLAEMKRRESEELNHAKLQFFTNITHELMTPLTIISASLDELKMDMPEGNDHYRVMSDNAGRLMRLIRQILEFRKAETGNLKLKVSEGDLARFVQVSVDSFKPLIKKKEIHLGLILEESAVRGWFDPDKMDKILFNLLSNAAKYNRRGGSVEVSLSVDRQAGTASIAVRDNGEGISPEKMGDLFKRFYEGDYRKFQTTGTGIGLSLTKDLVDLHKGTIVVESESGYGTRFTVTLPIRKEAYPEEQIDEALVPVEDREDAEVQPVPEETPPVITDYSIVEADEDTLAENPLYHILLVEDNEDLLQLMNRLLGREYQVSLARNGRQALEIAEGGESDLIVSDVMMPEMDGIELTRQIKSRFELCHIQVVLLTVLQTDEDRIVGYDSGADGYVTKPFSLSLLHSRIKGLLKNRERTARDFKKQMVLETAELNYTSMDEAFMQKAVDSVYRHLDDPEFDLDRFVEEMGTSKSTLYSKIKSLTGLHTTAFIRNIRLKAACRLMEEKKRIRISELAYAVGFNDAKYFSACFKKEFGILPTEYLEKYRTGE
jgi:ligand-binding sensor domain-containing protein/signal transduction histidine kinase/DNA-binding response OmpR family regulator